MIKINNLEKIYDNQKILDNVSFEINDTDFIAVMGPSGSGKSTLLYSISGMDNINSGEIMYKGKAIHDFNEKEMAEFRLKHMGFVFQFPQMLKNLNIIDNIMLPGIVLGESSYDDINVKASVLMEKLEIVHVKNNDIKSVSGGQLQRAAICRSLINNPSILFMDEPTGALNSEASEQVLNIIEQLNMDGVTVFMVTHDKYVASRAKKILYMMDGNIKSVFENTKTSTIDNIDQWIKEMHK